MRKRLLNIYRLGIKELRSLWHDKIMLILIAYAFSVGIYVGATSTSMELHHVPVAIVDEDRSMLSKRIEDAFLPPYFSRPVPIAHTQIDAGLDAGIYTFVITIPHGFEKEVIAGRRPAMQLNIDATRLSQAGIGAGYIRQMVSDEVGDFLSGSGTGVITSYSIHYTKLYEQHFSQWEIHLRSAAACWRLSRFRRGVSAICVGVP